MKQLYGMSQNGNLAEAVKNIRNPKLLILASNPGQKNWKNFIRRYRVLVALP